MKTVSENERYEELGAGSSVRREPCDVAQTKGVGKSTELTTNNIQDFDWMDSGAAFVCTEW